MRENLHRFFRAARGAGIHVSPAESIDAMRAVAQVGITDRTILRDTLLLTLAKSQEEKLALGDCFDLFFNQPEPREDQPEADNDDASQDAADQTTSSSSAGESDEDQPPEGLGPLAQMLLRFAEATVYSGQSVGKSAGLADDRFPFRRVLRYTGQPWEGDRRLW